MKTESEKKIHSLTNCKEEESFTQLKDFYNHLPVAAMLCNTNFTICWLNEEAGNWSEETLKMILCLYEGVKEEIFEKLQECGQVKMTQMAELRFYCLCFRKINDRYFMVEIQKQEQFRPYWLSQQENLLLASFEENVRLWASNIFGVLEAIKKGLQMAEKYREADLVDVVFENCMSILKYIETYADYRALLENDPEDILSLDVCHELKNICEVVQAQIQLGKTPFTWDVPNETIICRVKPREFRRAVLHLLSNAFKFTSPDNAVTLKAFVQNHRFVIQVSDQGTGIPMEDFDKIFDPFYSYDPNTHMAAGAGLGLPYVRAFMEKYHKEKTAPILESRQNGGTRVAISLPIQKDPEDYILYDDGSDRTDVLRGKYSVYQVYLSDILNQSPD